jgi:hypothetical protein
MKALHTVKDSDKTKKPTEIRMGREVPIVPQPPAPLSEKDQKAKTREDQASSLV